MSLEGGGQKIIAMCKNVCALECNFSARSLLTRVQHFPQCGHMNVIARTPPSKFASYISQCMYVNAFSQPAPSSFAFDISHNVCISMKFPSPLPPNSLLTLLTMFASVCDFSASSHLTRISCICVITLYMSEAS